MTVSLAMQNGRLAGGGDRNNMNDVNDMSDNEPKSKQSDAQRFYDALQTIALFQSPSRLRRCSEERKCSEKEWGLSYPEALEIAYENIIDTAQRAVRGKRRPK
jgi:hypothetical protein